MLVACYPIYPSHWTCSSSLANTTTHSSRRLNTFTRFAQVLEPSLLTRSYFTPYSSSLNIRLSDQDGTYRPPQLLGRRSISLLDRSHLSNMYRIAPSPSSNADDSKIAVVPNSDMSNCN